MKIAISIKAAFKLDRKIRTFQGQHKLNQFMNTKLAQEKK